MFGWNKSTPKADDHQLSGLKMGTDGRPRPPRFADLNTPQDATTEQKLQCINWAVAWSRTEGVEATSLLDLFDKYLVGTYIPRKTPGLLALSAATRALSHAVQSNRMKRSRKALPWVEFRLGPQEFPCATATTMAGVIVPADPGFDLPLIGCDQAECKCWVRQLTTREKAAREG